MNKSARSRRRRARNPVARVLPWFTGALFGYLGIAALTGQNWMLSQYIVAALFLAGGGVAIAYTVFGVRAGSVSMVSPTTGTTSRVDRRREPIGFFVQIGLYLGFGMLMALLGLWFLFA